MGLGTWVCLNLHWKILSNPMVEKNYIRAYRQRRQDFVMDWLKIMQ